jgi:uncharacterized protein YjlB
MLMSLGYTVAGMCYMCSSDATIVVFAAGIARSLAAGCVQLRSGVGHRERDESKVFMVVGYWCALMFMFV